MRNLLNNKSKNINKNMKISEKKLRNIIRESIEEYLVNSGELMSGYDISPYDSDENNWRDKLSNGAYRLYLTAESNKGVVDMKEALIRALLKKDVKGLSVEKLAKSSIIEKMCSKVVALEYAAGGEQNISSADRRQFKEFYAKHILDIDLNEYR